MLSLGMVGTGMASRLCPGMGLLRLINGFGGLVGARMSSPSSLWDQPTNGMLWMEPSPRSSYGFAEVPQLGWSSGADVTHAVGYNGAVMPSLGCP